MVPEIDGQSDEQLAADAAREGSDGPAFVALVERYRERVWRICFRLVGNAEDAQDAAQEVLVQMFLRRASFEGRSRYSTWVHGIALRVCLSTRRSLGRRRKHEQVARDRRPASVESAPQSEAAMDLLQMLDTLDDVDRALLLMKHVEGHQYDELSEMFGLSISACKMRVSRACDRLRETFPDTRLDR